MARDLYAGNVDCDPNLGKQCVEEENFYGVGVRRGVDQEGGRERDAGDSERHV